MKFLFFLMILCISFSGCASSYYQVSDQELIEVVRYHSPRVENVFQKLVKASPELAGLNLKLSVVEYLFAQKGTVPVSSVRLYPFFRLGVVTVSKEIFDESHQFLPFALGHEIAHVFIDNSNFKYLPIRKKELYADVLAIEISGRAGYDKNKTVQAACRWLLSRDKFFIERGVDPFDESLDHPAGATRCKRLKAWLRKNK